MSSPLLPHDEPVLVHGVSWSETPMPQDTVPDTSASDVADQRRPHLVMMRPLTRPDDAPRLSVPLVGQRLAFDVDPAGRFCLGRRVTPPPGSDALRHEPCPQNRLATTGTQCEECARRDDARFMHHAHRGGYVPDGIDRQLTTRHWLYVATFADGSSKVGTAIDHRRRVRLDEQGALRGTYVARTDDGRTIRVLEDAVTADAGIPQTKRKSGKAAGLTRTLPPRTLDARHADAVTQAVTALTTLPGERPLTTWEPPPLHGQFFERQGVHPVYPHSLAAGQHCLTPIALVGSVALVAVNLPHRHSAPDEIALVDLDDLRGRRVTFVDDARSPESALQHSLF